DDRLDIFVRGQLWKSILHENKQADECPSCHAAYQPEQDERNRLLQVERCNHRKLNVRHGKGRIWADKNSTYRRRSSRCHDDGKKSAVRHFGQKNFERKQNATERGVEGSSDTSAGPR